MLQNKDKSNQMASETIAPTQEIDADGWFTAPELPVPACSQSFCVDKAAIGCGTCQKFWCEQHRPPTNTCERSAHWATKIALAKMIRLRDRNMEAHPISARHTHLPDVKRIKMYFCQVCGQKFNLRDLCIAHYRDIHGPYQVD